jgi:succinyl-CoA synthetase beta subunit
MNTHEFQAKKILQKFGIPVPDFAVASSLGEVDKILREKGWDSAVVKVQIHAGGRGKAGGVKFAKTPQEIISVSRELLGKKIVNNQTGPEGMISYHLLLSAPVDIKKEMYLAVTVSREKGKRVLIASPVGGMDIEKVAEETPDKVLVISIPSDGQLRSYHLLTLSKFMGWQGEMAKQGQQIVKNLIQAFIETDAVLFEINPLAVTKEEKLIALDAKLVVDENALFRQPEMKDMFDPHQVPAQEAEAQKHELAYVALDGDIGCMVNGAGLAMATMDIIEAYGGRPANFLDVGGGASKEKVAEGFKIILSDPKVKAILINIFGGIMNCETLAQGVVEAAKDLEIHVPLVVRMEGTNVEKGREIINQSKLNIQIADNIADAAKLVVQSQESKGEIRNSEFGK